MPWVKVSLSIALADLELANLFYITLYIKRSTCLCLPTLIFKVWATIPSLLCFCILFWDRIYSLRCPGTLLHEAYLTWPQTWILLPLYLWCLDYYCAFLSYLRDKLQCFPWNLANPFHIYIILGCLSKKTQKIIVFVNMM